MRRLLVVSLAFFILALTLFFLAGRQRAAAAYEPQGTGRPNLIHEIIAPDSPVSPGFRFFNLLGFAFLAASIIGFAADKRNKDKQYN